MVINNNGNWYCDENDTPPHLLNGLNNRNNRNNKIIQILMRIKIKII